MIRSLIYLPLIMASCSALAIVIRHDVADKNYLAQQSDFIQLATLYVDGAHGTLINANWVVTAAHATFCLRGGSYIKLNNRFRKVERVFVHKNYQPGKSHDIALIKLLEPVNDVSPVKLYEHADELGKITWFIGVGGTGNGLVGQQVDNFANGGVLRKAHNKIEQAAGPLLKFKFDRGEAALSFEGVSGAGDSGGPAYITIGDSHYLLGISSRFEGEAVGKYGVTEVYSRVSFFKPWIDQMISADETVIKQVSLPKLSQLPTGLTAAMLSDVCAEIGLKPIDI